MGQKKNKKRLPPLEEGIVMAMRAIDNQVAREMQRTPAEREEQGVQKWSPYGKRIEQLCVQLVSLLGNQECQLDSLLVLSQASAKALCMVIEDLESEGLGNVRSGYCLDAMENIQRDARNGLQALQGYGGTGLV